MGQQNQRPQKVEENLDGTNPAVKKLNLAKILQRKKAHRRLPLEMECEIFKFLKWKIQQKLIYGMGRGIYGMFSQKVLTKCKRVQNPRRNRWRNDGTSAEVIKFSRGLKAVNTNSERQYILAKQGFPIPAQHCRCDYFPGTILYYFEVKVIEISSDCSYYVGLSDGNIAHGTWIGNSPNCYFLQSHSKHCWLSMEKQCAAFPWQKNANYDDAWELKKNVVGCGLLLDPDNKLDIFFTVNGKRWGSQITIKHLPAATAGDCCLLYATVHMRNANLSANFGDNSAKPFKYNVKDFGKCRYY